MTYETDKAFQKAISFVLEQECRRKKDGTLDDGYINDKFDPGGETKYGISHRAYPKLDIKQLTLATALGLYYTDYWYVASGEAFPLNVCVLDCAVNQGTKLAKQLLFNCDKNWEKFNENRMQHYLALLHGKFKDNPNRMQYQKAWMSRLNNLKKFIDVSLASDTSKLI